MPEIEFNEASYLKLHDDVRVAVANGNFKSGREHYEKYGRAEGRKMSRFDADSHSIRDYSKLVRRLIDTHLDNKALAMAKAIGALTLDIFKESGDKHVHVLRNLGLQDGYSIYDLACGCGRTASALRRNGWSGHYRGADIIAELVEYAQETNPGFEFLVHHDYSIAAASDTLDMVYSWSLFTHLHLEEIFLYAKDCHRALKENGVLVFSFLTLKDGNHRELFGQRVQALEKGVGFVHLDTFLDEDTIKTLMVEMLGYKLIGFLDADDNSVTPTGSFGQAIAIFRK
jgi:SAM-dependent methyltransferase